MRTKKTNKIKEVKKVSQTQGTVDAIDFIFAGKEIQVLKNQNKILMEECGKLAGQVAVAVRDKETFEKTLKAQISSTSWALEAQAKSNKRMIIAWVLMCITSFILGFYICHFFAFYLGKVF